MKKKLIFIFIISLFLLVGFLVLLQNLNISGVIDVKTVKDPAVRAGLNQTCATPTFKISCSGGLTCATKNNISDFDPRYATARCIPTRFVKDLSSNVWRNKK